MPLSPDEINATIAGFATLAQTTGASGVTPEALIELSNNMPLYENTEDRQAVEAVPSLIGAWPKMFLMIEDAFHKAKEEGEKDGADVDQIIRIQAQEIAVAIYTYVNSAVVHTMVNTTTTGTGVKTGLSRNNSVGELNIVPSGNVQVGGSSSSSSGAA